MSGSIETYLNAKRSGAYQHPDQKKVFEEGPAYGAKEKLPIGDQLPKKSILWTLLLMLMASGSTYYAFNPQEAKEAIDSRIESPIFSGDEVEQIEVVEKDQIPKNDYRVQQDLAFEKLRAWERLTQDIVDKFFATPVQPGYKRTLCISMNGEKHCRTRKAPIQSEADVLVH